MSLNREGYVILYFLKKNHFLKLNEVVNSIGYWEFKRHSLGEDDGVYSVYTKS